MEGSNLVKGVDAGGERWFLDDEPVHAGAVVEILLELDPEYDSDTGAVVGFRPLWLPVRVEFDDGKALVFWPNAGADMSTEMRSEVAAGALFKWPKK